MEWLSKGTYHYEDQHPPLARVAAALGPWLAGLHSWNRPLMYNEGAAILYTDGGVQYDRNLALARLGILPFYWLACLVVFFWARLEFGPLTAFLAALLFSTLPPVLAHSGLATTDMALTAFCGAAFYMLLRWVATPTPLITTLFGVTLGFALLSKLSILVYFPAAVMATALWFRLKDKTPLSVLGRDFARRALPLAAAVAIAVFIVWAGYRFSFGRAHFGWKVPAPEFFNGIDTVQKHNANGNPSYMLGRQSNSGFWYYYFVDLAIKTPLGVLALLALGIVLIVREKRAAMAVPLAFCAGILSVAIFSRINIGIRHVLPLYLGIAIVAAYAAERMLKARVRWMPALAGLLLVWPLLSSALAHPDYIPYFNEIVGSEPEKWVVDSDYDWGQDMKRLSARLRELGATQVSFSPFIVAHLERVHGFPPMQPNDPVNPDPGWNAISTTNWKQARLGLFQKHPELALWPDYARPTERVGTNLLYYFAPRTARP
jgi:4-amino-4-deoxy-L-arabinose transferase-like glycosyltransferase